MTLIALFLSILHRAGAFQKFQWETTAKQSAKSKREDGPVTLTKVTSAVVRTGVEYKNLAANIDRETGALPWGEWHTYPYIVSHKGNFYGRIYANRKSVKSVYFVNGERASRAEWLSFQPPSADKAREENPPATLTLTVKLENLQAVPVTADDLAEIDA